MTFSGLKFVFGVKGLELGACVVCVYKRMRFWREKEHQDPQTGEDGGRSECRVVLLLLLLLSSYS